MKRTLLSTILSLIALTTPTLSYASDLSDGLQMWWDFDTSNQPVDGFGNAVTVEPSGELGWNEEEGFGIIGSNTGNSLSTSTPNVINANSFTLSLDVKNSSGGIDWSALFSIEFANGESLITMNNGLDLDLWTTEAENALVVENGNALISQDSFSTITLTSDGNYLSMYVNGVLANKIDVSGESWTSSTIDKINIGTDGWDSADIDNIGVWDRVLTEQEIGELAQIPEPSSTAMGLLGASVFLLRRRRPANKQAKKALN